MKRMILLLAAVLPLCASCVQSDDPAERRALTAARLLQKERRIKIAVAGPWAQKRNCLLDGLELARDELNAAGGVLGATLELVPFDDGGNMAQGSRAAYEIAADESICAVIGHSASSISVSNSLIYHYYGLLMFSPLSTSRNLARQGLPLVFRNIPDEDAIGTAAAEFCGQSGWNRVMIYYLNNSYGAGLSNAFELQCGESGIAIPDRASYESVYGVHDYSEVARVWKENYSFDAVFIAGSMPQAGEIVTIFRANGITVPIIGGDAFDVPMFFQIAGNETEAQVYAVTNFSSEQKSAAFSAFRTAFKARYGRDIDQAAFQGYDALMVLAQAMEAAQSVRGADIAAALKAADEWNEAAGPYRFDESGNIVGRTLTVKKAEGGSFQEVQR